MEMELAQFLMSLDCKEFDDKVLLQMLFKYPEEIVKKSGKPVAFVAYKKKGFVYRDGMWGKDMYSQLEIFAFVNGKYMRYSFASKPVFEVGQTNDGLVYGQYAEQEFGSKQALANGKATMYSLQSLTADRITKGFYGVGDAKLLIDGFVNTWRKELTA